MSELGPIELGWFNNYKNGNCPQHHAHWTHWWLDKMCNFTTRGVNCTSRIRTTEHPLTDLLILTPTRLRAGTTIALSSTCIFFFRVLHTIFSHLRAHAFARPVTVARSSSIQASSSRRQERRRAIVCGSPQSQSTD